MGLVLPLYRFEAKNFDFTVFLLISLLESKPRCKIVSEYDQEIPQSQTADKLMAPRGLVLYDIYRCYGTCNTKGRDNGLKIGKWPI